MKITILFLCAWVLTGSLCIAQPQPIEKLLQQAQKLEKEFKESDAFSIYKEILKQQPNYFIALVRSSELASRIGKQQASSKEQESYYKLAYAYAIKAVQLQPNDSEANVVLAIAYGRLALMRTGEQKIEYVKEIKSHAEKALVSNKQNFKALHVLGKWHYEVSNLNFFERTAVRWLYGGFPNATIDSSIYFYEKAKNIAPAFALNYLELAKAKKRKGERKQALALLNTIFTLPFTSVEDTAIRNEASQLLETWKD